MNQMTVEGNDLVIRVALNMKPMASKSGKSRVIGSTNGFVSQNTPFGVVKIGLNVITTDEDFGRAAPAPKLVKTA